MSTRDELLMRHHDGELDPEETRELERLLASSEEARALLADFEVIGGVMRAFAEERGSAAEDIADRVLAALPAEPPRKRRLVALYPAAGVLLAAAAAVALLLRPHPKPGPAALAVEGTVSAPSSTALPAPSTETSDTAAALEPETGASIESIDFGGRNGTIFMVASGPRMTPVVWLLDDSTPEGARMKPL